MNEQYAQPNQPSQNKLPLSAIDAVLEATQNYPRRTAIAFMQHRVRYARLEKMIDLVARGLSSLGIKKGQCVTIALPNIPQMIYCLYAVKLLGAFPCVVHPNSSSEEIVTYMKHNHSHVLIALDTYYKKAEIAMREIEFHKLIVTDIADELHFLHGSIYRLIDYKRPFVPRNANTIWWPRLLQIGKEYKNTFIKKKSNRQTRKLLQKKQARLLYVGVPIWDIYGFSTSVHTPLAHGGKIILSVETTANKILAFWKKKKPHAIIATKETALEMMDLLLESSKLSKKFANAKQKFFLETFVLFGFADDETKEKLTTFFKNYAKNIFFASSQEDNDNA